jgi:hypothetical protein
MWHAVSGFSELMARAIMLLRLWLLVLVCAASPACADVVWLDGVRSALGITAPVEKRDPLADATRHIAGLTVRPPALVLAASVTAEGHWTFVNRAGQRYTTASRQEMARVYENLASDIEGRPSPVVIYIVGASVFAHGEHLALLPKDARLRLLTRDESYPLRMFGRGAKRTWFAEMASNVFVEAGEAQTFVEAEWQLARVMSQRAIRIVALEPTARDTFQPVAAKGNGATKQAIDVINPDKIASALSTLRGQTAVLTGRLIGGDKLIYRTPIGAEQELALQPLRRAAALADTNLVFVNASAPRQPGARNWLWLRVEVDGLAEALQRKTLGDFLNALTGGNDRLFVAVRARGNDRVSLSVIPMHAGVLEKEPGIVSNVLAELISEVVGNVLPHAVDADLLSRQRHMELERRIIPGVAAWVPYTFAGLLLAGLLALPVALRWWWRIWSPEVREDYASRGGFEAARGVRLLVFLTLFLPIAGLPAIIWGMVRWLGHLFGGGRRNKADAGGAKL